MIPALVASMFAQSLPPSDGIIAKEKEKNPPQERPGFSVWPELSYIVNTYLSNDGRFYEGSLGFNTKLFFYNQSFKNLFSASSALAGGLGVGWNLSAGRQQIYGTFDFRYKKNVTSFDPETYPPLAPWLATIGIGGDLGIIFGGGKHLPIEAIKYPPSPELTKTIAFDSCFFGLSAAAFLRVGAWFHMFVGVDLMAEYLWNERSGFYVKEGSSGWRFDPGFKLGLGLP